MSYTAKINLFVLTSGTMGLVKGKLHKERKARCVIWLLCALAVPTIGISSVVWRLDKLPAPPTAHRFAQLAKTSPCPTTPSSCNCPSTPCPAPSTPRWRRLVATPSATWHSCLWGNFSFRVWTVNLMFLLFVLQKIYHHKKGIKFKHYHCQQKVPVFSLVFLICL